MNTIRVLFVGDIVGVPGREMFKKHINQICADYAIDGVVVNGENSSNKGRGITPSVAEFFKECGVDVITTGNHIWDAREIYPYLDEHNFVLRPANYPSETPGVGVTTFQCKGVTVGVINVLGRVFMKTNLDCPFRTAESLVISLKKTTNIIFVDMHAEATSEKIGLGYFLDGNVSGIVGTHTHTPTADERILPHGTAYISDLGMTGSLNSMLGMKKDPIMKNFLTQMPIRFEVAYESPLVLYGAWIEVDTQSGKAVRIERISIIDKDIQVTE